MKTFYQGIWEKLAKQFYVWSDFTTLKFWEFSFLTKVSAALVVVYFFCFEGWLEEVSRAQVLSELIN